AGFAAGGAEAALAGEADGMDRPARLAAITDEATLRGPAGERFGDGLLCRLGHRSRQAGVEQWLDALPMLRQDLGQQPRRTQPMTLPTLFSCSKCPYFS